MRSWYLLLLLLLLPTFAWAQEGEVADEESVEAAETEPVEYELYTASNFGFSIDLPPASVLRTPADADWDEDERTAFVWRGMPGDPVSLILARVDGVADLADEPMNLVRFQAFLDVMKSRWVESGGIKQLVNEPDPIEANGFVWHVFDVRQKVVTPDEQAANVYYTVFCTYAADRIYTITFYYLTEADEAVYSFGGPIVSSFSVR